MPLIRGIKVINLWKDGSDFPHLNVLSFGITDVQYYVVFFNFSLILEIY